MNDDSAIIPEDAFRQYLSGLKQTGCNLLVTGEVREAVSRRITRKMLGDPELPRTRIVALTDQDREDVPNLLPGEVAPSDECVRVVDPGFGTRSATAVSAPGSDREWSRSDLDDLQMRLCNAITTAKIAASGFEPAELRLSLFTLSHLVNQHEPAAVERFVSAVGDHVGGNSGMAHYHLPLPADSKTVRRLSSLFDARVELREKHGRPEQRWHFPDDGLSTAWVAL
jgi:hypothetical protein